MSLFLRFILISAIFFLGVEDIFAQDNVVYVDTSKNTMYNHIDLDTVYRQFKNTSIKIKTPKYFVEFESDKISGFMNTGIAASIVAFEYDKTPYVGYYDELADKKSDQVGNANFVRAEAMKTDSGKPAKMYFYTFVLKDIEINRLIFYTGDKEQMIFMQANYPASFDALIRPVLIQSFLTVQYK